MDSFSLPPTDSGQQEVSMEEIIDQVKLQLAQAFTQQIIQNVREKCFEKCISKPGSSLTGSDGSCVSRCADRYLEATGIISKALFDQSG